LHLKMTNHVVDTCRKLHEMRRENADKVCVMCDEC
jgi:hypothetical protein